MTIETVPSPAKLLDQLAALRVDVEQLGVDRTKPRISAAAFFELWRRLEALGDRDLGLRVGSGERMAGPPSIASRAALHAPTLRAAIERLAHYKRLSCPEEITLDEAHGEAAVRFEWLLADEAPPPLLVDAILASLVVLARRGTGQPIGPRRLELARRRRDQAMLRRHFGCAIVFDAPADRCVFDARDLDLPFVTHDPAWSAKLLPALDTALASRSVADRVRVALAREVGERPAVAKVARRLGMSARTLQRRLGEDGTTYQDVLDDVRRRSARRLLADTDLDTGEVAFLLGFEEMNSFARAFHAWEGTTPLRWRAAERKIDDQTSSAAYRVR